MASASSGRADIRTVVRLLRSQFRLRGLGPFWLIGFAPGAVSGIGSQPALMNWFMALSMALAFLIKLDSEDRIICREHRVLPVTSRDLWVAQWLSSTLLPPLWLLAFKLIVLVWDQAFHPGQPPLIPADTLFLSTVFDVVFAGVMVAPPHLTEQWAIQRTRRLRIESSPLEWTATAMPLLVGLAAPFLLARSLPVRFHEITLPAVIVLTIGLGLAFFGLAWTREPGIDRLMFRDPHKRPAPTVPGKPRFDDRFTGIPSIAWRHIRLTLLLSVSTYLTIIVGAALAPWPGAADRKLATLMFLMISMVVVIFEGPWSAWARQLKVLPISARQLNSLFTFSPLATWAAIWLVLMATHLAMGWQVRDYVRPQAILLYASSTSLTHALSLRFGTGVFVRITLLMVGPLAAITAAFALLARPGIAAPSSILAVGCLVFLLAAAINHYTLTRSTSSAHAYRRLRAAV